jgi:plastocyanin domain-containing protein
MKVAAIALVYLGVTSIYGGLVALGLVNFHKISATTNKENLASSAQIIDIRVTNDGYSPSNIVVKKGTPVMIRVTSKNAYSCALAFRVPSLGVSKNMQPNDSYIFTFTPNETGSIPFFCSMGMYRGLIEVR